MINQFSRLEMLVGEDTLQKISDRTIAIFGIGGVGGNVVDSLVRSGFKKFILVDNDVVSLTNINRQYVANQNTIGKLKVEVMKEHILSISRDAKVEIFAQFIDENNIVEFNFNNIDYIVDAIDSVSSKVALICRANELNIPIISALGCGNRLDPTKLVVSDIHKTSGDPLARIIRQKMREKGIKKLKVVYSLEEPIKASESEEQVDKEHIPGSSSFVPPAAGIIIASEVFKDLKNS